VRRSLEPNLLRKNAESFSQYADKIVHITIDDMPDSEDPWKLEAHLRNAIARGLFSCQDSDVIMVSDIAEIPRKETVRSLGEIGGDIFSLHMPIYYCYLNCRLLIDWIGTVVTTYGVSKKNAPQELRNNRSQYAAVPNAGSQLPRRQ
jgi:hypothetical protein